MKKYFTIFALTLFSVVAFAQDRISGSVLDENSSPVSFANVVLMSADSAFINGTITDVDGKFSVDKNSEAKLLSVSCLGYETQVVDIQSNYFKIVLKTSSIELDEITVSAGLPKTRIKDGAMITDVQNSALAKVGSTERMLGKIPGVIKTKDGFEVFGKGTPEIYINGVKMRNNNELENINPENIKNVEVITNPGAQYDSEVKSVIKITTLKPVGEGLGGNLKSSLYVGKNTDLTEIINLNYRKNKLDIFTTLRYSLYNNWEKQWGEIANNSNYHWKNANNLICNVKSNYIPLTVGLNYQPDEKNSFGAKYSANVSTVNEGVMQNSLSVFRDDVLYDNINVSSEFETKNRQNQQLNTYYNGLLGGFLVNFNADFMLQISDKFDKNYDLSDNFETREIVSKNTIVNKFLAQKLIVGHQLMGGELFLGAETVFTNRDDDYLSDSQQYVPTVLSQNKQQSVAGFLEYGYVVAKKVQLKAGLRYEHVNFDYYDDGEKISEASRIYNQLFPSASVATQFGVVQMMLSYTEKIRRPRYNELRNSVSYSSRYHREYGDPTLKPSIVRNLSLMTSAGFAQMSLSYTNTSNYIALWQTVEPLSQEVEKVVPININHLPTFGVQLAIAPEFGFWQPNFEIQLQKQWLSVVSEGVKKSLNKPICNITFENVFCFNKGWSFEFDSYYYGSGNNAYMYLSHKYFTFEAYLEKTFFNDALSIELGVSDIFFKTRNDLTVSTETGFLDIHKQSDTREFSLIVKYRFNPSKSKYKGTGAGEEERRRM